jgi:hypothetical protein
MRKLNLAIAKEIATLQQSEDYFMCRNATSNPPQQQQDDQDQKDQSDSAAGIGSPGLTVAPGGQGANKQKDQYDNQDDSHDIILLSSFPISDFISSKEILKCFGHSP